MATKNEISQLDALEHIRARPGMYIGRLGDGTTSADGIYTLLKEILENSITALKVSEGKTLKIKISNQSKLGQEIQIKDSGCGMPTEALLELVSKIHTELTFQGFQKPANSNGVGLKAVNALSAQFTAITQRDGKAKKIYFEQGRLINERILKGSKSNGTTIKFVPDPMIFGEYKLKNQHIQKMLYTYSRQNPRLEIDLVIGKEKLNYRGPEAGIIDF